MAVPGFQKLILPFLKILADGNEHTVEEVTEVLSTQFKLNEDDKRERIASGAKKFDNRIGWGRTYLKKAGLLEISGLGKVKITSQGLQALKKNPSEINVRYLYQFPTFAEWRKQGKVPEERELEETGQTPEEIIASNYRKYRAKLATDLLEQIKACSPRFFEQLVIDLLVQMGYGGSKEDAEAVGRSGDGGIDGIVKQDKLGLDVIYVQAKRWETNVPGDKVRAFSGSLDVKRASKGVFITTSQFTEEAKKHAELIGKKIILIGGEQLAQYMIDHGLGVTERTDYPVWKKIDFDYFQE